MQLDPTIFHAYDIRGLVPDQLNGDGAEQIGRAFAATMQAETVVVGRDVRLSGPELHAQAIEGITRVGVNVLDIGVVSTDAFYYTCGRRGLPGIMVTASHNPAPDNGFKMVKALPLPLMARDFRSQVIDRHYPDAAHPGSVTTVDIIDEFLRYLLQLVPAKKLRPLKVVIDTSNGTQGPIWQRLAQHLPIKIVPLCFEPDGRFPNHGNDVIQPSNQAMLRHAVIKEAADLGLIFDPDGDRCLLVDDRGRTVPGDFVTALLAVDMLSREPGGTIVYDARASDAVPDFITAAGGKPYVWKVGHAHIKPKMQELGAIFGGEVSGHYFFKEFWYSDCGLLAGLMMLEYISSLEEPLSQKILELEAIYHISGEINSKVDDVPAVLALIKKAYADAAIDESMGLAVRYPSWHFMVRPSDNEPFLRLTLEARTETEMIARRDEVLKLIRA